MTDDVDLVGFIRTVAGGDTARARQRLTDTPGLVTARIARTAEFFVPVCHAQVYAGDSALHAAAFAYDVDLTHLLLAQGADVRAPNRRGAEPLHAATIGAPGSANWAPDRQTAVIAVLIDAGADPDARAKGGVTPLHRAVRNRCAAAVEALLDAGADPLAANDNGSTAAMLARWTTGRSGSGSEAARAEQQRIVRLLA